jgi:hypothetical protein
MSTLQLKGLIVGSGNKAPVAIEAAIPKRDNSISATLDYKGAWSLVRSSGSGYGHISGEAKSSSKPTITYEVQINDTQLYAKGQAIDGVLLVTPGMFGNTSEYESWAQPIEAALPTMPTKETVFSFLDRSNVNTTVLLVPVPASSITENIGGSNYTDCTEASLKFSGKAENLSIGSGNQYFDWSFINASDYITTGSLNINGSGMAKIQSS